MHRMCKPGNTSICNKKRMKEEVSEEEINDEEMFHLLFDMACKIKELEELKEIRVAH